MCAVDRRYDFLMLEKRKKLGEHTKVGEWLRVSMLVCINGYSYVCISQDIL